MTWRATSSHGEHQSSFQEDLVRRFENAGEQSSITATMADNAAANEGTIPETQFNAHLQPPPEGPNGYAEEMDAKRSVSKTPESQQPPNPRKNQQDEKDEALGTPPSPETPPHYDWDEFERRYEQALRGADDKEKEILKEADSLAQVR